MSSTVTDTDSSVIFMGEQHIVQLHLDQEQRINQSNFVQNTQSPRESGEGTEVDVTTIPETPVTLIPETQNTGKTNTINNYIVSSVIITTILSKKKHNLSGKLRIRQ